MRCGCGRRQCSLRPLANWSITGGLHGTRNWQGAVNVVSYGHALRTRNTDTHYGHTRYAIRVYGRKVRAQQNCDPMVKECPEGLFSSVFGGTSADVFGVHVCRGGDHPRGPPAWRHPVRGGRGRPVHGAARYDPGAAGERDAAQRRDGAGQVRLVQVTAFEVARRLRA